MPLLRSQKKDLAKQYIDNFNKSVNVIVLTFDKLPVNELNQIRMDIADTQGVLQVVKKRILLKALDGSFEGLTLDEANATVMLLYVHNEEDEHAPLKVIQKYIKKRTKAKVDYTIDYVGGRYEKSRHQADWVRQLATLPTKEELVGKFLFLLNHPISSLARAFQAIADRDGVSAEVETKVASPVEKVEPTETKAEEPSVTEPETPQETAEETPAQTTPETDSSDETTAEPSTEETPSE